MNRLAPLTALLALTTLSGAGFAWYEYRELTQLRAEGMTPDDRARLQKSAWDARKEVRRLQTQLSAAQVMHSGEDVTRPAADNHRALGEIAADYLSRLDEPEIRRLMDQRAMANIALQYAQFFRDAKLTPAQIQQFEQLMVERQRAQTDVIEAAAEQGINPMSDPQEFRQMVRSAQADIDHQIKASLGADDWSQYQQYQQAQNQRGVVNQLQQNLSFTDTPLTDAQRQQMVQIIAQTNKPGGGAITQQTLTLAQGVLSPQQYQALQTLQQVQQTNQQLGRLMQQRRGP